MFHSIMLFVYILSFLFMFLHFFIYNKKAYIAAQTFMVVAVLLNIGVFISKWVKTNSFPASSLYDVLILTMLFLGIGYLILFLLYKRPFISLLVLPFIIAAGVGSSLSMNIIYQKPYISKFWIYIHLPLTIGGSAFFLISALIGIIYFIQERQLKNKNFGLIFKNFPPIDTINRLNTFTLFTGFVLFSGGIISGIVWGLIEWDGVFFLTPKFLFAFITWIVFGLIILIKKTKGLTPKKTALFSVLGIFLILLTYHGVAVFLIR